MSLQRVLVEMAQYWTAKQCREVRQILEQRERELARHKHNWEGAREGATPVGWRICIDCSLGERLA